MLVLNFKTVNNWFYENFIISNLRKCYSMFIGKDGHDQDVFYYDNLTLKNSNEDERLGITTDRKQLFGNILKNAP